MSVRGTSSEVTPQALMALLAEQSRRVDENFALLIREGREVVSNIRTLQDRINSLESENSSLKRKVSKLEGTVTSLENTVTGLGIYASSLDNRKRPRTSSQAAQATARPSENGPSGNRPPLASPPPKLTPRMQDAISILQNLRAAPPPLPPLSFKLAR